MDAIIDGDVASSHLSNWHSINWKATSCAVSRMQARIAKAAKDKQWRRVTRLQKLLVRSTAAKATAVRRVTENQGRRTPGVDRATWSTPAAKWNAINSLQRKGYKAKPLRRIHIPKARGGTRPLGIPTMKDRAMQALYLYALDPVAEAYGDIHSYGFRSFRSTADAAAHLKTCLSTKTSSRWVMEGDIKGCFDNISHDWLMKHVPIDRHVLSQWLKAGFMEDRKLFPTDAGTPQGGIISPVLANIVLDGLGRLIDALPRRNKCNFVRYADDFVITGASAEILERKVKPIVVKFLAERGLTLSESKTKITHMDEGFDFLGWNFRKFGNLLLRRPSKQNTNAFMAKIRSQLRLLRGSTQDDVLHVLNPIIRGWGMYHQVVNASEPFARLDHLIHHAVWCWAKRRHPTKGLRWIKRRYFRRDKSRDWIFGVGKHTLMRLSSLKVGEYIKVRSDVSPYDPKDESYFNQRLQYRMKRSLAGKRKLLWLWTKQEAKCACCGRKLTSTSWHIHHKVFRVYGGSDRLSNLVLLHTTCHEQLHARARLRLSPPPIDEGGL
ncbi:MULTISPECIES: group II intron reverse transcriptase/maturase [Stenotrophomonas]|uniref:group II intron reverse transcriptase/maturase n=1 Tax=Stenotrophomonas TaxID=40323 RepID=UPI0021C5C26F|nr:group II intron reverse transcriptase/maturase [Stenotrophomonas maltophilia]